MKIEEIINKNIITASKSESVVDVANKMKKYNIGFLPVVDNSKIIGVITDRDIVINCVANNNDKNETIENYINKNIVSIDLNNKIIDVLNLMNNNKIKRLIVADNNKVVGIISLADILKTDLKTELLTAIKNIWNINDSQKNNDAKIDEYYL